MLLFHASQTPNLKMLTPHVSNHGKALVYFSEKSEYTLVYLSNAVEKCCREAGIDFQGTYHTWASYGFAENGLLCLDEYYPDATRDTYQGQSGYIYTVRKNDCCKAFDGIPHTFVSAAAVEVLSYTFVPDAYEALEAAKACGKVILNRYEDNSREKLAWIRQGIEREYAEAKDDPAYRFFLESKFSFIR